MGSTGIDSLAAWQRSLVEDRGAPFPYHVTRMFPRRAEEILNGGSIFWVIQGFITARQKVVGLEPVTGADGVGRCRFDLDPELVPTMKIAKRPFQGWRYLKVEDAPADAPHSDEQNGQAELVQELADLGLL